MSLTGDSGDNTIVMTAPYSQGDADGLGGYDLLDLSNTVGRVLVNFPSGIVSEILGIGSAGFANFEAFRLSAQNDVVRWVITVPPGAVAYDFDAGAGTQDIMRIMEDALVDGARLEAIDFSTGRIWGVRDGQEVTFATISGFEVMTLEIVGNFAAIGTAQEDVINFRGVGDNHIRAFGGDDTIVPGAGDDIVDGGAGNDWVNYSTARSGIAVYLEYTGRSIGGEMGRDTLISIENVYGSIYNDRLVGDAVDNEINGYNGDDIMLGKDGDDTLTGGRGADVLRGGAGNDFLNAGADDDVLFGLTGEDVLWGGDGADYLYGGRDHDVLEGDADADALRGNLGNDTLRGGFGDDNLRGGGGNDTLEGGNDNDILFGGNGRDVIQGGAGADVLTGGKGSGFLDGLRDVFVLTSSDISFGDFDRVKDFEDGIDQIELSGFSGLSFEDYLLPKASNTTTGMRLNFGEGAVLFLEDFTVAQFDASDVVFS